MTRFCGDLCLFFKPGGPVNFFCDRSSRFRKFGSCPTVVGWRLFCGRLGRRKLKRTC